VPDRALVRHSSPTRWRLIRVFRSAVPIAERVDRDASERHPGAVWQHPAMPTVTRSLQLADATALSALYAENRAFLAPWQPLRPASYFTETGQREAAETALAQAASGSSVPLVILDSSGLVAGTLTIASIIRGAFQSCSVGYWLAERAQGQGLATAALREAAVLAFDDLRLHRMQAETLTRNARSQRVLERVGFEQYGVAASYMHIAGEWQDNVLYQLLTPTPERVVTYR
jgi:ribosomal-protein-alanine N-acetyltransferase